MITELAYNLEEQQAMLQQHQQQLRQDHCQAQQVSQQILPVDQMQENAPFCQPQRSPEKQSQFYHQQKLTTMQSGAYRVKLVNYALAKPVRS